MSLFANNEDYAASMFQLSDVCDFNISPVAVTGADGKITSLRDSSAQWIKAANTEVIDSDWVNNQFMVGRNQIGANRPYKTVKDANGRSRIVYLSGDTLDSMNAYRSTAQWKWTNTSLGGSLAINPRPQFTRYCDIRTYGLSVGDTASSLQVSAKTSNGSLHIKGTGNKSGVGRYYSEAIEDNQEVIYMQFGVPRFNNMVSFFTRAISYEDAMIANTGRYPKMYTVGQVVGGLFMLAAFPLLTAVVVVSKLAYAFLSGDEAYSYYYMEPTMHTYWGSVNYIVTQLATELGLLIPELMPDGTEPNKNRLGMPARINAESLALLKEYLPGYISDNNYIDVFKIATNAQTAANAQRKKQRELFAKDNFDPNLLTGYSVNPAQLNRDTLVDKMDSAISFQSFLDWVTGSGQTEGEAVQDTSVGVSGDPLFKNKADDHEHEYSITKMEKNQAEGEQFTTIKDSVQSGAKGGEGATTADSPAITNSSQAYAKDSDGTYPSDESKNQGWWSRLGQSMDSTVRGGGAYLILNVDYTGSLSDSFSSSVSNIDAGDAIKSAAQGARNIKFNLAGGNFLGDTVNSLMGGLKDFVAGAADSITMGLSNVITTLTGGAYVDVPKKWDDSDAQLSTINYSIDLISPYGNVLSQLQNLYIPLACILAAALPQKAGESSYTSPFLCSIFNKGKQNIRLGMITSLTIERGTSNLGFSRDKRPLAFKISFSVTDFSNIMTTPVSASLFSMFKTSINDSSLLGRYLGTLCSRDLLTDKYLVPRLKIKASRLLMTKDQATSAHNVGFMLGDTLFTPVSNLLHDMSIAGGTLQNN